MKIPQIQALRALAALLVLAYHSNVIPGGYVGVDIFYVISGFLITGLLLKELESSTSLNLRAFYARRAKRLLPSSFLVLSLTAVIAWWIYPVTMRHELGKHIIAAATYISNFLFALWGNDYQNLNATPPITIHYWSLAVEEQFYLFWPFAIYLAFRAGGRRLVAKVVLVITLTSFAFSLYLTNASPVWSFYLLPTRAWELGIGALLLFLPPRWSRNHHRFALLSTSFAFLALIFSLSRLTDSTPFPGTAAITPVISTAVLIAFSNTWIFGLDHLSRWRSTQWLGAISYPLYLWHWPALVLPALYLGRNLTWLEKGLAIAMTVALADLTHRFVEEPLRHVSAPPAKALTYSLIGTLALTLLGGAIYATYTERIHIRGSNVIFYLPDVTKKPRIYEDGCNSNYEKSIPDTCEYGDLTSEREIVLFGDSHAGQWFPALEEIAVRHHLKLVVFTKSACPAAEVVRIDAPTARYKRCITWRNLVIEELKSMQPDTIIMSGFQHYALPKQFSSEAEWLLDGQQKLDEKLTGLYSTLIYMSDTPLPARDIPSCLALKRAHQCIAHRSSSAVISDFIPINPSLWLCKEVCSSLRDSTVLYRDDSHISVDGSLALMKDLEKELYALGVI